MTFPTTPVGGFSLASLSIGNGGASTLSVSVGTLTAPFAIYYPGTYSIPPGLSLQLMLMFSPVKAGAASEQLIVSTSDPRNPKVTLTLSGIGAGTSSARANVRPNTSKLRPRLSRSEAANLRMSLGF